MSWTATPDGRTTCDVHSTSFAAGIETCAACDREADAEPRSDVREITPPPVSEQAILDEAWCRAQRDLLGDLAKEMRDARAKNGSKDRAGYSTVAKILDVALKYHRTAIEERIRRDEVDHDRWLAEQNALLAGAGVAH